jgi:hypothetical protein
MSATYVYIYAGVCECMHVWFNIKSHVYTNIRIGFGEVWKEVAMLYFKAFAVRLREVMKRVYYSQPGIKGYRECNSDMSTLR